MVRLPSGLTRRVMVADQAQGAPTGHGPDFGELWERREWIRARVSQLSGDSARGTRDVSQDEEMSPPDLEADGGPPASVRGDSAKEKTSKIR